MANNIQCEIQVLDHEEDVIWGRDFDSKKAAKEWMKEFGFDRQTWVQRAESETWPDQIMRIQLVSVSDGEETIHEEWFPAWAKQSD